MGENQCGKCGETVDEAKAFCPACGNSLVEEKKRTSVSDFDLSNKTVRLGNTMYNQMLSDMGLSVSKQPSRDEKQRLEVIAPVVAAAPDSSAKHRAEPPATGAPAWRRTIIWIAVFVMVAAIVVVLAAIIIAAIVLYSR